MEKFLVDGGAESYRGVSVLFIDDHRDPVMVLYLQATGEEQRRIPLIQYDSEEALTGLMTSLGFTKRTKKEYEAYKEKQAKKQADMDEENEHRIFNEQRAMSNKKDEIANRVMEMMQKNMKKMQEENEKIMRD